MNQIDNYIQSFLNGSLGAEGHTVLRQWIKEKPENRYYFQAQVAIWKATGVISNAEEFDVTGAINRFNKKAKQVNRIDFYRCTLRFSVVAIILLICGISSLFFLWQSEGRVSEVVEEYREYVVEVPDGAKSKITFPDGSIVWLNAGSKVKYDSNFAKASRKVELTGEGYFEVSKNKELPFLIDAAPVELKPNQRFTLRKADLSMQVDSVDASHIDNWRNGAMTFDKVPLEEIAKELKRLYNIPIRIESDKLKQIVYYSDFQENVSVEKVLEILSSGNKFRYEIKSEEIRIFN